MNLEIETRLAQNSRRIFWILFLVIGLSCLAFASETPTRQTEGDTFQGNPPICPRWALEPWVWEDNCKTQQTICELIQEYLKRNIPVGVVLIGNPWETTYNTFAWDSERYADPEIMIRQFHAKDIKIVMWINGVLRTDSPDYRYVIRERYVTDGGRRNNWWQGSGVHLDFTNPDAKKWWHSKMDQVLNLGIDGWKVDQSVHFLDQTVQTSIGKMPKQQHGFYYYADMYDYTLKKNPAAVIMARPYSHPDQGGIAAPVSKCTIAWVGDSHGDWDGLKRQVDLLYRAAQAGYGAPCIEIGGSLGAKPSKNTFVRYAQLAALTPVMSNGGANGGLSNHLPWFHDDQTVRIFKYFAALHSELVPYLFSYSVESHLKGTSILRESDRQKHQHLLGEVLFISAITSDTEQKSMNPPSDRYWIDYWNESKVYKGGSTFDYTVPLERYPIFIKAGAVIPLNVKNTLTGHGDETSVGKQTLLIYPFGKSEFVYHKPTSDGIGYSDITINVDEAAGFVVVNGEREEDFRFRVKCFTKPRSVKGADSWRYAENDNYIIIDKKGRQFRIDIDGLNAYERHGDYTL